MNSNFSGVHAAIGDLDGNGSNEVITAPMEGQPFIRAFTAAGAPFIPPREIDPVGFFAFPETFTGGARVATADVDFDGAHEILVTPGPGLPHEIKAFEANGTPVEGFQVFEPFPGLSNGIVIVGTDRYVRK